MTPAAIRAQRSSSLRGVLHPDNDALYINGMFFLLSSLMFVVLTAAFLLLHEHQKCQHEIAHNRRSRAAASFPPLSPQRVNLLFGNLHVPQNGFKATFFMGFFSIVVSLFLPNSSSRKAFLAVFFLSGLQQNNVTRLNRISSLAAAAAAGPSSSGYLAAWLGDKIR